MADDCAPSPSLLRAPTIMAFTDFGIGNLTDLIQMHKDDPTLLKRRNCEN
jgi:hypothetical protein